MNPMNVLSARRAVLAIVFAVLPSGLAPAQTLEDALDTPGVAWTPSGTVTALNDPALAHDGVDVVRIDAALTVPESGAYPSIKTTLTVPTVVEFWHRSDDLRAITVLGRNNRSIAVSSIWRQERWLQWPATVPGWNDLEIQNRGQPGSGPLYLDEVSLRPAVQISLAEALDFPAFTGTVAPAGSVLGFAESWLAPDGEDAVALEGTLSVSLPANTFHTFRSRGGEFTPAVSLSGGNGQQTPTFTEGDRSWTFTAAAGVYHFSRTNLGGSVPYYYSTAPVVLDAYSPVTTVPVNEALDAPDLLFTTTGHVGGITALSGSPDGDALLILEPTEGLDRSGSVSLTIPGPGTVRFSTRGDGRFSQTGDKAAGSFASDTWNSQEVPVYRSGEILTWYSRGGGFWLDAVSFVPGTGELSIADLLNAPGLVSEVLVPAWFGAPPGQPEGDAPLQIYPLSPVALQPLLRLHFSGASVISLEIQDETKTAMVRVDGGGWQSPDYFSKTPFAAIVPGEGPHTLELTGAALLDHFKVIPLATLPLAEALGAPGLTFTTSPGLPWSGYNVPEGLGFQGDHAAFGGSHSTAGDPWIETQITGPGILKSKATVAAAGQNSPLNPLRYPKQFLDGVLVDPYFTRPEIWISPGEHTVRWQQQGSQVTSGTGTLVALGSVSFTPVEPISISEALDTVGRAWTIGGSGEVTAVTWAGDSPDGVDSVQIKTDPAQDPSWLETEVMLPCTLSFRGADISVSIGSGNSLFGLSRNASSSGNLRGFGTVSSVVPGSGPARVRFTAKQSGAVLDAVSFQQPSGVLLPSVDLGTGPEEWRQYGGIPWQVIPDEAGGPDRYRSTSGQNLWMESVVTGPGKMGASAITLPEYGNRKLINGWLPFPGPTRVLVMLPADTLVQALTLQPTPPVSTWNSDPAITWSTGGDVPWQATFAGTTRSGPVWPGENSWIEAAVAGPGVLTWNAVLSSIDVGVNLTCDGVRVPQVIPGWLHLSPGTHRIRWETAVPMDGFRNATGVLTLSDAAFTSQPTGSVSAILSGGTLNFIEGLKTARPASPAGPLAWPGASGWQIVNDPDLPGPALRGDFNSGLFAALLPSRGTLASRLKMDGATVPGANHVTALPDAAAPFPWLPWTGDGPLPRREGFRTSAAQFVFTPATPVSLAEALDQPGLAWTSGSQPPGLWQPLTEAGSGQDDPDALYFTGAAMGDSAWLETTVEGPLDITTQFENSTGAEVGLRILVDNVPAGSERDYGLIRSSSETFYNALRVPADSHTVRWEITPPAPVPSGLFALIRSITLTTAPALPDVSALLDSPTLEWSVIGNSPTALTGGAHDGVDALLLGGGGVLTTAFNGPGLLSFWMKGAGSGSLLSLDSVPVPSAPGSSSTWLSYTLPIPAGRHTLSFRAGSNQTALDELAFTALPALTPEEVLDTTAGITLPASHADQFGSAAWPAFSDDGVDSLLLMPGTAHRLAVKVPELSTISLRVRSVFGTGSFAFQDLPSASTSTTWTTRTFSTHANGGTGTVYLRASTVPVLIDKLTVTTPDPDNNYFTWAGRAGLTAAWQGTFSDPDLDGLTNFAEFAFGLDPLLADTAALASEEQPGLPSISLFTAPDGKQYLQVLFWRRAGVSATVETAAEPAGYSQFDEPGGWTAAANAAATTSLPGGFTRVLWRSPDPVVPGTRQFARVRCLLP